MTDAGRRWSLRCASLRQSFTEVRSTCGNRGSIELNWDWFKTQDNSPLRACLLSRVILVQSRCLRDSRGSKLGKMFPGLGLRGSVKQCPGQSWRMWA